MIRKVLHLIDTRDLSGPGKTIVNSCRFAAAWEYRKQVAVFSHANNNKFIEYVRRQGISGYEIEERQWWLPGPLSHGAELYQLRSLLKKEEIDLLHTHGFKADVLGLLATLGTKVKVVSTQHGFISNTKLSRLYNWLAVVACKRMDKVIAVSKGMRDTLKLAGVLEGKIVVIHNAIVVTDYPLCDRSKVLIERHKLNGRGPILGCIGRLSREKGQEVLCQAFIRLKSKIPSACLLLIGDGPDSLGLRAKYAENLNDIIFVGHVSNIREYLSIMDLHVLPSFTEGLPNVVLEAACMQVPTVATSVGGTPECILDGATGLLVAPGDVERLVDAILRLAVNDQMRREFGSAAANFVAKYFSFEYRAAKMKSVYDEIFSENEPGGLLPASKTPS